MPTQVALVVGAVLLLWWVLLLARELRRALRARSHWSQPTGDDGGLVYVALGDSVAQGVGASRPERGYVGLLADELSSRTGKPVKVINLSRSGDRIRDVLTTQLPALAQLAVHPDLITIDVGANDVRGYQSDRFALDVEELTDALPAGTFVADVPYFMHAQWERDAREAAAVLTASAGRHGLTVVPLHEALRAEGWRAMLTEFAPDWFHPNDQGHRVWAQTFWSTIARSREDWVV